MNNMLSSASFKAKDIATKYIVGIGASAGGMEAIHDLFDHMPEDTGFAFVVVQHLSPDHKSLMPELLSKHTYMQVFEAADGMEIQPNCVYVLPSKMVMTIRHDTLYLDEKLKNRLPNNAVDIFFESLAKDKGAAAIGIILSGSGTDGSKGAEAIKRRGGAVIVQEPLSAVFDGMPGSAIATGVADLILSPDMIAEELVAFVNDEVFPPSMYSADHKDESILREILELIHRATRYDFSHYKRPTLFRRLLKRMTEKGVSTLKEYYTYLEKNPEEMKILVKEFLINVTKFFRDPEAFTELQTQVLPAIFAAKKASDEIKIWVMACSSGEEAYSLAMIILEYMEEHHIAGQPVKIFASDIDYEALDTASRGVYPASIRKDVSAKRIRQFFTEEGEQYRVSPSLRKLVVFAHHDILKDPPFSRIDLISCRNMLIYVDPVLQKRALKKFHFALNLHGFLFLGPSENIGILKDTTLEISRKWKIYQCISKAKTYEQEHLYGSFETRPHAHAISSPVLTLKNPLNNVADIFKETMLETNRFTGIFVDKEFNVIQAVGAFKNIIHFPEDQFNLNLLKLVSSDLSIPLGVCLRKALTQQEKVILRHVKMQDMNPERHINIIVKPWLQPKQYTQAFLFVVLEEEETAQKAPSMPAFASSNGNETERLEELHRELNDTRASLQAIIEEMEAANEELQAQGEELVSTNEELQSTNEELQSLNEELYTVSAEHQMKIKELHELNDDLNNYFRNSDIGQIFVDRRLIVRKFSPVSTRMVNLIESDIGRSITDISINFKSLDFINDLKEAMKSSLVSEKEISLEDGRNYLLRISPYLRLDKLVDGAVINFIDITEMKKSAELIEQNFAALEIASARLNETNLMLERTNMDLMQFASVASHDLKEPLRKIQVFGNMLETKAGDTLGRTEGEYLKKIISASTRMQVLIEDVLTLSKLSHDLLPRENTDLREIVLGICDDLEISILEKKAVVDIELLPSLPVIPGQMRQMFQNLIVNALKFSDKQNPEIHIRECPVNKEQSAAFNISPTDYVCIMVRDNGAGFDNKYREKIFELFERLNGRNFDGTGIGLAIVKKIVENHRGFITAHGEPGQGATFSILLPKKKPGVEASEPVAA